jgi:hypothetical protein
MMRKMIEINLESQWTCRVGPVSWMFPPPPYFLIPWQKNPIPSQPLNTRHTCTLSNTQLHNSLSRISVFALDCN